MILSVFQYWGAGGFHLVCLLVRIFKQKEKYTEIKKSYFQASVDETAQEELGNKQQRLSYKINYHAEKDSLDTSLGF